MVTPKILISYYVRYSRKETATHSLLAIPAERYGALVLPDSRDENIHRLKLTTLQKLRILIVTFIKKKRKILDLYSINFLSLIYRICPPSANLYCLRVLMSNKT